MAHSPAPWTVDPVYGDSVGNETNQIQIAYDITNPSDAALIAAAPDLLEACKMAAVYIDLCGPGGDGTKSALRILNQAIAKAKG